ncbi:MAG: carbohydrate binding family 9 domain-containing protein [Flavobacteriales bacterium]|nr:carbohydrate binding family 9 domain-containing protein [Flavobacteriales bacterium]
MKKHLIIFLLLPLISFSQFTEKKIYNIKKIDKNPNIDGILNDKIWGNLDIAKDFSQLEPNNGEKEKHHQRTEVKMCYDDRNIYLGVMMYDNAPDSILTELSRRDQENKNYDEFGIWINPFNDGQIEYNFSVTAAGVQKDAKFFPSGSDNTWDAVWKSAVKINNNGWVAEFAIPFSSLRFSNDGKPWAINMGRTIRRYRSVYTWNPIDAEYLSSISLQAGLIDGIKNVNPPLRLSFMPYASVYTNIYNGETTFPYNYGMDLKYGINESFTLDMTLIPDFGQVASDAEILNLSPFEIKYEEKRQFFNEGTELFNKGENMFYSRRIQDDLINATKVSGRTKNGLGFATLNAITNQTENKPLTNYNVMIFDQTFGNNSSISMMNTNMIQNGSNKDANVTGLFARINNKANTHTYVGELKMSQEFITETLPILIYPPEHSINITKGFSGMLSIGKISGKYRYDLWSSFEDDKYNPNDLGFLYSNNEINSGLSISYNQLKENKQFISSRFSSAISYETLFTEQKFVNLNLDMEGRVTFRNHLTVFMSAEINPYQGNDFYESRTENFNNPVKLSKSVKVRTHISTDYRKSFAIDLSLGGKLNPLYDGYSYHWRISPRYRINDKSSIRYVLSLENKYNDIGFVTNDTLPILIYPPETRFVFGKRDVFMITNVLEGSYILNNKMDFSTKIRHYWSGVKYNQFSELETNGYLSNTNYFSGHDANFNAWTIDMALNWWFAPGSQMSIVWKNSMQDYNDILTIDWFDNINNTFNTIPQNSLSFKIVYYLDYLYLRKKQ